MTHKNIIFLPQQNTLCDNITIINTNMTSLAINFNNMKGYCYNLKRKAILLLTEVGIPATIAKRRYFL